MRSLFDDTKNPVFRLLCQIVNEIGDGAQLTRRDILKRIFSLPEFIYVEAPERLREEKIVDMLFNFNGAGFAEIPSRKKFSLPMSDTELQWLRAVVADAEIAFVLPDELRKKILSRLENFQPLYEKTSWRKLHAAKKISAGEKFSDKLATLVEALRLRRKIISGEELLTPCRLEYDLAADKYFLIVWREESRAVEKISVETMAAVSLSAETIPPDCDACLKNFYSQNAAEVSLKILNTRNAVERCFALFSSFDKTARVQDDGTYFLTVNYCVLDEGEVLEKIFSLGSAVTVIAPERLRQSIIDRFAAIKALYK